MESQSVDNQSTQTGITSEHPMLGQWAVSRFVEAAPSGNQDVAVALLGPGDERLYTLNMSVEEADHLSVLLARLAAQAFVRQTERSQ